MKRRIPLAAALVGLALSAAAGFAPAATAAPQAAYACQAGHFCIYKDWNGAGTPCQWSASKIHNTADDCSWIRKGSVVRSLYNRTGHRVQYYTQDNYNKRVGSTPSGGRGSLAGTYQIRSFKPS